MAFLDDLGKKISHAGQTAVQKTRELTDIAKLNDSISDEEKKRDSNYTQIGRLYTALHSENYESDFEQLITAVRESETKIQNYQQQIKDIKGIENCVKCGAEISDNASFCSICGSPVPQRNSTNIDFTKCPNCGQSIAEDMRFCISCGTPIIHSLSNEEKSEEQQEVL